MTNAHFDCMNGFLKHRQRCMCSSTHLPNQESLKLFECNMVPLWNITLCWANTLFESPSSELKLEPRSSSALVCLTSWNWGLGSNCLSWQVFLAISQRSGCRWTVSFFSTFRNKHLSWEVHWKFLRRSSAQLKDLSLCKRAPNTFHYVLSKEQFWFCPCALWEPVASFFQAQWSACISTWGFWCASDKIQLQVNR